MGIIDDGTYKWEEVYVAIKEQIEIERRGRYREEERYSTIRMMYGFIYDLVHNRLAKEREIKGNEESIREICKYVISEMIPYIMEIIGEIERKIKSSKDIGLAKLLSECYDLEDNLYAMGSFRSLTHFAHYMERQDDRSQLVWKYNMEGTMGSIFYYSNAMILNHKYKNLIKQCPTGYGKCFKEELRVLTDRGYIKGKELKVGDKVYSIKDNKLVLREIKNIWRSEKEQIKVNTRSGMEIVVSPEHRMYTQRGYVKAEELRKEDYLYEVCSAIEYGEKIDNNEMKFITMMLFDGSCTQKNTSFIKQDNQIYQECIKVCDNLGFKTTDYKLKDRNCNILLLLRNNNKVNELLEKYGILDCYAKTKRLPKQFFNMSLKQRYEFIGIMLATDGYIPESNNRGGNNMGISLANKELCEDIQKILFTSGIYSNLTSRTIKTNGKEFKAWVVTIPDEYVEVIYKNCYCYQKQEALERKYKQLQGLKIKPYSNSINYPKELLNNCKEFKKIVNKQWSRNKTFKREIVHKYIQDKNIISNELVWNKISNIEYINEKVPMIDIEVEETHNFILEGAVSHNSKSDCVIIAFCLGYDVNDDIMKIVGNRNLVKPITQSIVKMLRSERFGKVFPEFGKYKGSNDMFKNCAETEGTFTLTDSKKSLTFACYNKETAIDGGRFNKQFYDDITQSDDRENINSHKKDRGRYDSQWKKRQYDEFSCLRWFTGTAYHREDFLSYIKKYYSNNQALEKESSTRKKKWNKFVKINNSKDTIYVSVPKLADLELGEDKCYCTFPQKYSKAEALKELHSSEYAVRRFMAMEQQEPLPAESLAFDWVYLKQYEELPIEIQENNCDTILIIDPSRKGKDNYAGLIFKKPCNDKDDYYYLVDCFYKKVSSKIAIPKICQRGAYHKVNEISFETNTVDDYQMKKEIKTIMVQNGWKDFSIKDFYSTKNKEDKISSVRDDIRDKIKFPKRGMYNEDSDMGRAMNDIVNYSFEGKNGNDDSIDCCAMLILCTNKKAKNSISTLNIEL